ncbi:MAG: hypothetical protein RI958_3230 [Actinomycetota bacterium]|jgi:DNA-binding response OmpR family regulator
MTRILIAEDEPRIVSFLTKGLSGAGYRTFSVDDGQDALALARDVSFDLLVLDLGLPGIDGHEVLRAMRARGERMPVIILTARDSIRDTVAGLDEGANDYLRKPVRFEELLARVRARLRDNTATPTQLTAGRVSLDTGRRRAVVDGRSVDLTTREYDLLESLVRHAGEVMSREQLLERVWGTEVDPASNVVDVYVRYLRKKLGDHVIETVRGAGYRVSAP